MATGIVVTKAVLRKLGSEVVSQLTAKPKVADNSRRFYVICIDSGLAKVPFILMAGILFTMAYYMMDIPS